MNRSDVKAAPQLIGRFITPETWGILIIPVVFIILKKWKVSLSAFPTDLGNAVFWVSPVVEQHYNFMLSHSSSADANNYVYYNFALICFCLLCLCMASARSWRYTDKILRPTAREFLIMSIPMLSYIVLDVFGLNAAKDVPYSWLSIRFDNFGTYYIHRLMEAFAIIFWLSYILIIAIAGCKGSFELRELR